MYWFLDIHRVALSISIYIYIHTQIQKAVRNNTNIVYNILSVNPVTLQEEKINSEVKCLLYFILHHIKNPHVQMTFGLALLLSSNLPSL